MGMRKAERRARLFDAGVAALAQTVRFEFEDDPRHGCYMCPICGSFGTRHEAVEGTGFDLDHYPARCVGGRTTLLTCRPCNNESGRKIDWHARAAADTASFVRGEAGSRGKVHIGGLRADARYEEYGLIIQFDERHNPPRGGRALEQLIADVREEGQFRFELETRADTRRAGLADLKAGYLAAFACFGYRWALQPALRGVQQQILVPEEETLDLPVFPAERVAGPGVLYLRGHAPLDMVVIVLPESQVVLPGLSQDAGWWDRFDGGRVKLPRMEILARDWPTWPQYTVDTRPVPGGIAWQLFEPPVAPTERLPAS